LRAVLEYPDDDVPRLVYADWFDDHGQPDRAAYIRHAVRVHQLDYCNPSRKDTKAEFAAWVWSGESAAHVAARQAAGGLWSRHWRAWTATPGWGNLGLAHRTGWEFDRGFVRRVSVRADRLSDRRLAALFGLHPVTRFVPDGRMWVMAPVLPPSMGQWAACWEAGPCTRERPCRVADAVFDDLDDYLWEGVRSGRRWRAYASGGLATAALARALIRRGRRLAGLSEWPPRFPLSEAPR
jgi:uncharacterized protein (TIGR02996 family)